MFLVVETLAAQPVPGTMLNHLNYKPQQRISIAGYLVSSRWDYKLGRALNLGH